MDGLRAARQGGVMPCAVCRRRRAAPLGLSATFLPAHCWPLVCCSPGPPRESVCGAKLQCTMLRAPAQRRRCCPRPWERRACSEARALRAVLAAAAGFSGWRRCALAASVGPAGLPAGLHFVSGGARSVRVRLPTRHGAPAEQRRCHGRLAWQCCRLWRRAAERAACACMPCVSAGAEPVGTAGLSRNRGGRRAAACEQAP